MKNILLATDLTANSDRAIARGLWLAKETGASLYVLHVAPPYPSKKMKALAQSLNVELQDLIRKQVEGQRFGKQVKTSVNIVQAADIYNEILTQSHNTKSDLIILGMHNKTKFRDFFVGTTMERVIHSGIKPVLVVKNAVAGGFKTVVSGIDYSPGAYSAFRMAKDISPEANFYAIHSYEIPYYAEEAYKYTSVLSKALVEERHQKAMDKFLKDEATLFTKNKTPGKGKLIGQLEPGSPAKVLAKKVKSLKADLLTIGSHGEIGFILPGTKLGGTALDILYDPPCDVLVANDWQSMSKTLV